MGSAVQAFESELQRDVDAPAVARRLLADCFAPVLGESTAAAARLLVSELVTNAVLHGRGRITLEAQLSEDRLRVTVSDGGTGFKREVREREFEQLGAGGWGLSIVDAESARWGVEEGTTRVWFELGLPSRALEPDSESPAT